MLNKDTEKVWQLLQGRPELQGFLLVGGSALALQIHHRDSEDLDFAYGETKLPKVQLELLRKNLVELLFEEANDPMAVREAEDCGLDLSDYSQTFLVNGTVKITFFVLDREDRTVVDHHVGQAFRIASIDEIFALKALVCAKRSKSRDWFDIYVLMKDHGYNFQQFHRIFADAGAEGSYDIAVNRLCYARPNAKDEGFSNLLPDPPTLDAMHQFFLQRKNAYEQEAAEREALRKLAE